MRGMRWPEVAELIRELGLGVNIQNRERGIRPLMTCTDLLVRPFFTQRWSEVQILVRPHGKSPLLEDQFPAPPLGLPMLVALLSCVQSVPSLTEKSERRKLPVDQFPRSGSF